MASRRTGVQIKGTKHAIQWLQHFFGCCPGLRHGAVPGMGVEGLLSTYWSQVRASSQSHEYPIQGVSTPGTMTLQCNQGRLYGGTVSFSSSMLYSIVTQSSFLS